MNAGLEKLTSSVAMTERWFHRANGSWLVLEHKAATSFDIPVFLFP